jgi:hypothetical protein
MALPVNLCEQKGVVMDPSKGSQVKHLYEVEHLSRRQIADALHMCTKTVSRIIEGVISPFIVPSPRCLARTFCRIFCTNTSADQIRIARGRMVSNPEATGGASRCKEERPRGCLAHGTIFFGTTCCCRCPEISETRQEIPLAPPGPLPLLRVGSSLGARLCAAIL